MSAAELAQLFYTRGWIVVPGVETITRQRLEAAIATFPEYVDHPRFDEIDSHRYYTCGGTSFCGSPSFFNHPFIMEFNDMTFIKNADLLHELGSILGLEYKSRLSNRTMVRGAGKTAPKESWHQDAPAKGREGDMWIGGWHNLDPSPQHFKAVAGTQVWGQIDGGGFQKIDKKDHVRYDAMLAAQAGQPGYDQRGYIIVPSGCLLLFAPTIVHAIDAKPSDDTSVKIFFAPHLTNHRESGIYMTNGRYMSGEEIRQRLVDNASLPLPSGQEGGVMMPASYFNFVDKQLPIYESFESQMLRPGAMKPLRDADGKITMKGHKYHDSTRCMRSLKEQGLPIYEHHPTTLNMMVPAAEPEVFDWDKKEVVVCKRPRI